VSLAATEQRHTVGTSHRDRYNPDTWTDEYTYLSRPGQHEIQANLLYDYRTNVASYPAWQAWLRERKPPTLGVWGRNDPSFIAPGAEAYRRDLPDAEIHLLDAGHSPSTRKTTRSRVSLSSSCPSIPSDEADSAKYCRNVRFGSEADILRRDSHVRFAPKADIWLSRTGMPASRFTTTAPSSAGPDHL